MKCRKFYSDLRYFFLTASIVGDSISSLVFRNSLGTYEIIFDSKFIKPETFEFILKMISYPV